MYMMCTVIDGICALQESACTVVAYKAERTTVVQRKPQVKKASGQGAVQNLVVCH